MKAFFLVALSLGWYCGFSTARMASLKSNVPPMFSASGVYTDYILNSGDSLAVIIGVTDQDVGKVASLHGKFLVVNGLKVICYDRNLGVFVVTGLHNSYASKNEVFSACQKAAGDVRLFLKTGSAKEIVSQCPFSNLNDAAVIKSFLDN